MKRVIGISILALVMVNLFPGSARSMTLDADPAKSQLERLTGDQVIEDSELDKIRGGFVWSGMNISFGANIRTFLNGELVLETIINWGDTGSSMQQIVSPLLAPAGASQLIDGVLTTGSIRMKVGGETVYLANQGNTAIMHNFENSLQNILINTASNQVIDHQVDANLSLGNYDSFRDGIMVDRMATALNQAAESASFASLGF